ncbi:MAG: hypothetical protein II949_06580 [Prevotella sp.]|jgi:hypothetical protein|nr:hypothetical protein [Prevotella sp.]
MALHGQLKIDGRKYGIVQAQYEFNQMLDETNKPKTRPQGGTITFVMPATNDDDLFFYKWMFSKTEVKSGTFVFTVWTYHNKRSFKTVKFENAYCVGLKDYFNDSDSRLMYTTVTIAAELIIVGDSDTAEFNNEWT